jgi:hypothetical protein
MNDANEELNQELEHAKHLATDLAMHLVEMGASKATILVFIADEKYEVTVTHIPVVEEQQS